MKPTHDSMMLNGNLRRGSATVLALLVTLLLMVLITATMTMTIVDSEMVQDFARNKRSFEAADSGIVHGKVVLAHALSSFNLSPGTTPEDVEDYALDVTANDPEDEEAISLLLENGTYIDAITPRNEVLTSNAFSTPDDVDAGYDTSYNLWTTDVDEPNVGDITLHHKFTYGYSITSEGRAELNGQGNKATRVEEGAFEVDLLRPSFSTYGYFTNSMKNQNDQQLWFYDGESYDGPTHVNAAPPTGQAAFFGHSVFNGPFTAVQETYEESILAGGANPEFNGGATWGVDPIATPTNGWSQLRASIGDLANVDNQTAMTNAQMRTKLGLTVDTSPVPQGVYVSSNSNSGSSPLGGIFVNGDATEVKFSVDGNDQVITIKMNNTDGGTFDGSHTWIIKTNNQSKNSSIQMDGGAIKTFNKKLNGMIHVDGSAQKVIGDGDAALGDIEDKQQITLSVKNDIYIADNITYEQNPVSVPGAKNILGIYSANGNVYLDDTAPSNMTLHASVMAASSGKGVGAEGLAVDGSYDYNYPDKGNWNLVGGLIEDRNQTTGVYYSNGHVTGYRWNFTYDDRFAEGTAPPFFPYVTKFQMQLGGIEAEDWGRKYY
jgi:hypothetical protein